ncbi:MAG: asparagine synthetase B [Chitinispirillia bacterium]|nr:asparagine synthetase B [Chitinispirillia bacterium]
MTKIIAKTILLLTVLAFSVNARLLIPMDNAQSDHLKAYGIVFKMVSEGARVHWLLNYRGGSFVAENAERFQINAKTAGVTIRPITNTDWAAILDEIENNNMEKVVLEKAPKIAVYTPEGKRPWDDAVTLALTYAEIPFDKVYDREVLGGKLADYDWLHLHHEDFTGQYSKFHASFSHAPWYQKQRLELETLAKELGFKYVSDCKKAVALTIRNFVEAGGFLFAMCSAPNTLEIALAALGTNIVSEVYGGPGLDPDYKAKLNFDNTMAFHNFTINTDPLVCSFDNIDVNQVNTPNRLPALDFVLFEFSAKLDPVPTMLNQNHTSVIKAYHGLLTSFNRDVIKPSVVILGEVPGTKMVQYIHGVFGKGQFTYLGGHDPEDYAHLVGSKHTMLELHKNSPGYRLILNNVLFPAAEKKEKKT